MIHFKKITRFCGALAILLTTSFNVYAQISSLQVIGTVEHNMDGVTDANVILYKNGQEVETTLSDHRGEFRFSMDVNAEYLIVIKKAGFYGKKIAFNTEVPQDVTGKWTMEFAMSLFKGCNGVDASALNDPVDRIKFSSNQADFISDEAYVRNMRGRIQNLMMDIDQCQADSYQQAMKEGNQMLQQGNYEEAMAKFEEAMEIYPGDRSATRKFAEAQRQLGTSQQSEATFNKAIKEADQLFAEGNYVAARTKYNEALRAKPDAHARARLAEIDKMNQQKYQSEQAQRAKDQEYSSLIAQANAAVASKDYATAKQLYDQAATVKPDATLPKQKSAEMTSMLAQQQQNAAEQAATDKAYSEALAMGQRALESGDYANAKTHFQRAMSIRPDQSLARDKLREAQDKEEAKNQEAAKAAKANQLQQIESALDEGDALLAKNDFEGAAVAYQRALQLDPNDSYAKKQINKAKSMQVSAQAAKQKALTKQFDDALSNGDDLLAGNQYEQAIAVYKQALMQKPNDPVATSKLAEAEARLASAQKQKAQEQAKQRQYENQLAQANSYLAQKQYAQAKQAYEAAATLYPNQSVPRSKIAEVDRLMAEQKKQEQIKSLNATGNQYFAAKNYIEARAAYQQVLAMNATDGNARQKIAELDRIEQEQANQAEAKRQREEQYARSIREADNFLAMKRYDEAKAAYQRAMGFKPNDAYGQGQISKIDGIQAEQLRAENEKKALEQKYAQTIQQADQALELKDYTAAKTAYQQALALKASESYPRQKINEINEIERVLAQQAAQQRALDAQYNQAIQQADNLLAANNLEQAKAAYQKAAGLKAQESYPKSQITRIDGLIAEQLRQANEQKALDQKYTAEIAKGDRAMAQNDLTVAKQAYQSASALKPGEAYPITQITKIDGQLAQAERERQEKAAFEQKYNGVLASADAAYDKRDYETAKASYNEALAMKPNATHPKERLQKIAQFERMIAAQQAQAKQNAKTTTTTAAKPKPASASKLANLKFTNDSERDKYLAQLKKDYPAGITLEIHKEKTSTTHRYIVIRGGEARELRKVKFNWGGVEYTDNGIPTSGQYFESQVKRRSGEAFQEFQY